MDPRIAALANRARRLGGPTRHDGGAVDRLVAPIRRPLDRRFFAELGRLDELALLSASVMHSAPPVTGPKVLVSSLRMWTHHNAQDVVLAHALRLRGADIEVLTCGGGQPVCEVGWGRRKSPRPCDRCGWYTDRLAEAAGYRQHRLGDYLPWGLEPRAAPMDVGADKVDALGAAAEVSAAWLTKSSQPASTAPGRDAVRDFQVATNGVERAAEAILAAARPDILILLNGLFASERVLAAIAKERGIEVVTYEMAPRRGTVIYGRAAPAPDMDMDALWEVARRTPLSPPEADALDFMVRGRMEGTESHEQYFDDQMDTEEDIRRALDVSEATPVVAAFTNLAWDTALLGKDLGFESMFTWLADAVAAMAERPDAVLVIRVHPAETRWGTAQPVVTELAARVGTLPSNVRVIGPDQAISSYTLMAMAERVLSYTSTVGLEAALRGTRVAVAGTTHYRGRGFTDDVANVSDLRGLIAARVRQGLEPERVELARRYAFAFFFQLMIPFRAVVNDGARIAHVPTDAQEIAPGSDVFLDAMCERLLDGRDIVLPRELALAS